jgi:membrane protease YdiL (CAAX protease family)
MGSYVDLLLFFVLALGLPWAIWLRLGLESKATALAMLAPGLVALVLMSTLSPLGIADSPIASCGPPIYFLIAWAVPVLWVGLLCLVNLLLGTATPSRLSDSPSDRRNVIGRLLFAASLGVLSLVAWLWPHLPWASAVPLGFRTWPSGIVTAGLAALIWLPARLLTRIRMDRETWTRALAGFPRYVVIVLLLSVLLPVLGEELAWRGFLLPRLGQVSIHLGLLGTLVVWWLFHVPVALLSPQVRDIPRWALGGSLLGIAGPCFFAAWLVLASGSLWPAVAFHITWNMVNPAMLGSIYTGNQGFLRGRIWLINGEGVLGFAVSLLLVAPAFYYLAAR